MALASMRSAVVVDGVAGLMPAQSSGATDGSNHQHDFSQGK